MNANEKYRVAFQHNLDFPVATAPTKPWSSRVDTSRPTVGTWTAEPGAVRTTLVRTSVWSTFAELFGADAVVAFDAELERCREQAEFAMEAYQQNREVAAGPFRNLGEVRRAFREA